MSRYGLPWYIFNKWQKYKAGQRWYGGVGGRGAVSSSFIKLSIEFYKKIFLFIFKFLFYKIDYLLLLQPVKKKGRGWGVGCAVQVPSPLIGLRIDLLLQPVSSWNLTPIDVFMVNSTYKKRGKMPTLNVIWMKISFTFSIYIFFKSIRHSFKIFLV